jgi:hypothetical protein
VTQFVVLAGCAAWIAWRTWGIVTGTDDGNGILLLPAIVILAHMGSVLNNRRAVRLDALCLGILFLLGAMRDTTRILAMDLGDEGWIFTGIELLMGMLLLVGWRLSHESVV